MSIECIKCNEGINPLRIKALPNTRVCVSCSTAGAYKAVSTINGVGDHTWNDIQILTPNQYSNYQKSETTKSNRFDSEEEIPILHKTYNTKSKK